MDTEKITLMVAAVDTLSVKLSDLCEPLKGSCLLKNDVGQKKKKIMRIPNKISKKKSPSYNPQTKFRTVIPALRQ